jgi:outer membrane murein-binding lipoprotein Lpp
MSVETTSGWIRTGVVVATLIGGMVAGYITVNEQLNNNTKDIATLAKQVDQLETDLRQNRLDAQRDRDAISELKGDMKAVRQSLEFLVQAARQHQFPRQ